MNNFFIVITAMMMMSWSSSNILAASSNCSSAYINCMCDNIKNLIYPDVCVQMLIPFAKSLHKDLNRTSRVAIGISLSQSNILAINVTSLYKSHVTSAYGGTLKSCKGHVTDARDNVLDSFVQIKNLTGGGDPLFLLNNVQTWMSAAITNLGTCQDEAKAYVKDDANDEDDAIKFESVVLNGTLRVTKVISNSLALVNVLAGVTDYPTKCG